MCICVFVLQSRSVVSSIAVSHTILDDRDREAYLATFIPSTCVSGTFNSVALS